jgi:hypothetical protein
MFNQEEPDIFGGETTKFQQSDSYQEAHSDLTDLTEEEFQYRYKATKAQYIALENAIKELQKANEALQEMSALNIDPEIAENTQMLIEDYARLLDQMHMASYWEREGR